MRRLFIFHFLFIHQEKQHGIVIESPITQVPINKLVHSPLNVRKKQSAGVAELASLIFSQGLIHNLVVVAQMKKKKSTGKYEVITGSRGLDALLLLRATGVSTQTMKFLAASSCGGSNSREPGREQRTRTGAPADLVVACRSLTKAGLSPDEIARRFGASSLTAKRYLKLTNVSPAIFKL